MIQSQEGIFFSGMRKRQNGTSFESRGTKGGDQQGCSVQWNVYAKGFQGRLEEGIGRKWQEETSGACSVKGELKII